MKFCFFPSVCNKNLTRFAAFVPDAQSEVDNSFNHSSLLTIQQKTCKLNHFIINIIIHILHISQIIIVFIIYNFYF